MDGQVPTGASSQVLSPSICFSMLHLLLHNTDIVKVTEKCCSCCEGEQEEKNFPRLSAGFAASEFSALSSSVVGGKEGRKREGRKLVHIFFKPFGGKTNACRA